MPHSLTVLRFIRDHLSLLTLVLVVFILAGAAVLLEALRGRRSRAEVFQLKRKLRDLESAQAAPGRTLNDPVVLTSRWVQSGRAATTSDGGCLLFIDRVSPVTNSADLTLRVDGYTRLNSRNVGVGERLEAKGKYGTYILELSGVEESQAKVAIALRSRHKDVGALD